MDILHPCVRTAADLALPGKVTPSSSPSVPAVPPCHSCSMPKSKARCKLRRQLARDTPAVSGRSAVRMGSRPAFLVGRLEQRLAPALLRGQGAHRTVPDQPMLPAQCPLLMSGRHPPKAGPTTMKTGTSGPHSMHLLKACIPAGLTFRSYRPIPSRAGLTTWGTVDCRMGPCPDKRRPCTSSPSLAPPHRHGVCRASTAVGIQNSCSSR